MQLSSTPIMTKFEQYMVQFDEVIPTLKNKQEFKDYHSEILDEMDADRELSDEDHDGLSRHLLMVSLMPPFAPPSEEAESPRHDVPLVGGKTPPLLMIEVV